MKAVLQLIENFKNTYKCVNTAKYLGDLPANHCTPVIIEKMMPAKNWIVQNQFLDGSIPWDEKGKCITQ